MQQAVPCAAPRVRAARRRSQVHRPGNAPLSGGVMNPPCRDRQPFLSPTLGPHAERNAGLPNGRGAVARRVGRRVKTRSSTWAGLVSLVRCKDHGAYAKREPGG